MVPRRFPAILRQMALAAALLLVFGCASIRPAPPEVSLFGLQLENLTLSHAILTADLSVYNPNASAITIERLRYSLALQNIRVAQGQSTHSVRIDPYETGQVAVRLSSSYLNLLRIGHQTQGKEEIPFVIDGEITIGGFGILRRTLPFKEDGIIPLQAWSQIAP